MSNIEEPIVRIKQLMEIKKITESELQRGSGIPQTTLNRILNGGNVMPGAAKKLAIPLHTTASYILFAEGSPVSEKKVPLIPWEEIGKHHESYPAHIICPVECSNRTFATFVNDDTMQTQRGLNYREGAIIFVDLEEKIGDGDRVLAILTDQKRPQLTFKQYLTAGDGALMPLNIRYPRVNRPFKLVGKVISGSEVEDTISDEEFIKINEIFNDYNQGCNHDN